MQHARQSVWQGRAGACGCALRVTVHTTATFFTTCYHVSKAYAVSCAYITTCPLLWVDVVALPVGPLGGLRTDAFIVLTVPPCCRVDGSLLANQCQVESLSSCYPGVAG